MRYEEAQVASLNAMLDVLYNEESLDTPYDGADEEDEFEWFQGGWNNLEWTK